MSMDNSLYRGRPEIEAIPNLMPRCYTLGCRYRQVTLPLVPRIAPEVAVSFTEQARTTVSASLVERTVKIAFLVAQGGAPAGVISAATTLLAQVTIRAMFLGRLRVAASVMFLVSAVAAGVGWTIHTRASQ
jgi:hypothetical protein